LVPTIEVLIADDHKMLREGLRSLLEREPGIAVIGEAANGAEAVLLTREMRPSVVIMDIEMPEINGIEATRRIAAEMPEAKDSAFEKLISTIRAVTTNGSFGTEACQRPQTP
jgi:DNA-binding NarL/FixJ family response regulator